MAISQNPILPKYHSPKSLLLHFSMRFLKRSESMQKYFKSPKQDVENVEIVNCPPPPQILQRICYDLS